MMETKSSSRKRHFVNIISKVFCILLVGVFLVNINCFNHHQVKAASDLSDAKSKAMEETIAELKRQMNEVDGDIKKAEKEQASTQEKVKNVEKLLNLTQEKIAVTLSLLDEYERQIDETLKTIDEKEKRLANLREKFLERMRITYEGGEATYLEMILGAKSLSDFLSRVELVGSMLEYDAKLIKQYKTEKKDLADTKAALEVKLAEQQEAHADLIAEQEEMERHIKKYESFIADLKQAEAELRAKYQNFKKAADEENARLQKYLKELEEKNKQQYVGGEFMWPVPINFTYISSKYGGRTLYGMYDFHLGIDIAGYGIFGAPIYAVNDGTVEIATSHYSYGNYVLISHGGGRATLYAHCSSLAVKAGQSVKKGQVIGYVGSTGNSTGPHLHFEIRINGYTVDPLTSGLIVVPK